MSTGLSIYEKINDPIQAVTQLGEMFTRSGMFGCQKIEQGQVLALACISEKVSPFELVKTYHIIEGKLEMKSSAMQARFLDMGGKCIWKSDLQSEDVAAAHFEFQDNKGDFSYSMEDAKREGLSDRKVWKKHGPDMLRARLTSKVIRMLAPQINAGIYAPEENEAFGVAQVEKELKLPEAPKAAPVIEAAVEIIETPPVVEVTEIVAEEKPLAERAMEVIKGIGEERVTHFLKSRGKIPADGDLSNLTDAYYTNIVTMPEVFERSIQVAEKEEGGK